VGVTDQPASRVWPWAENGLFLKNLSSPQYAFLNKNAHLLNQGLFTFSKLVGKNANIPLPPSCLAYLGEVTQIGGATTLSITFK
jgi:hypothetical protein